MGLRPTQGDERGARPKGLRRENEAWGGAVKIGTALERLSLVGSLIRNARLNP